MEQLWTIIDKDTLIQLGVFVAVFLFVKYGKGKVSLTTYGDMKQTLLVAGMLFKMNKKQRKVYDLVEAIVENAEKMELSNEEKRNVAMQIATKEITKALGSKTNLQLIEILVSVAFQKQTK